MFKTKTKRTQSTTTSPESTKQSSPFSSRKKLITIQKEQSPKNSSKNVSQSPKNKDSKSPKFSEARKSIIHTQRFDRAKTLKVVIRRPSEAVNTPKSQNLQFNSERFSFDIDLKNEQNPLNLIPRSIILYEESKKLIKKVTNTIENKNDFFCRNLTKKPFL